eukprot:GILJ01001308.1.p1 GENE.GILJ01001308.1~~GILJ01001308.1.p1  ORF type:complete len:318 (+),score=40.64 GILJ01001308.1:88-954(+)
MASRSVIKKVLSVEQAEGVGARVRRSIGRPELRNFDPFLMLDEFRVAPPAGFSDHPHRGFETVTYMLEGSVQHEDFVGHAGTIDPGDLQWMTAGRGILHAEMPVNKCHGLQLWVNLAAKDKMCEPAYQELKKESIPSVTKDGVTAVVIAGEALGIKSPVYTRTPTSYLDFKMEPNSTLRQSIPAHWNAFTYVLSGKALFGSPESEVTAHHTAVFSRAENEDVVTVRTQDEPCRFVLIAGQPLNEPIVQYGPFVMNTQEQIQQAFQDYRNASNGFERAASWESRIAHGL